MDRSYLSHAEVVAASRPFVCVRLATYESAEEAVFLKSIFTGRSGELENTTFALLAPDGKTRLSRAGRSPDAAFGGARDQTPAAAMAEGLNEVAARYAKNSPKECTALPLCEDVRLGLDIASCDGQPLVVVCGEDEGARTKLAERTGLAAWTAPLIGRAAYAVAVKAADLKSVEGAAGRSGLLVIQPDPYGTKGKVLAAAPLDADAERIAKTLAEGIAAHRAVQKDPRTFIQEGRRLGIDWKSEIPDTDPGPGGAPPGGPPPGKR